MALSYTWECHTHTYISNRKKWKRRLWWYCTKGGIALR